MAYAVVSVQVVVSTSHSAIVCFYSLARHVWPRIEAAKQVFVPFERFLSSSLASLASLVSLGMAVLGDFTVQSDSQCPRPLWSQDWFLISVAYRLTTTTKTTLHALLLHRRFDRRVFGPTPRSSALALVLLVHAICSP